MLRVAWCPFLLIFLLFIEYPKLKCREDFGLFLYWIGSKWDAVLLLQNIMWCYAAILMLYQNPQEIYWFLIFFFLPPLLYFAFISFVLSHERLKCLDVLGRKWKQMCCDLIQQLMERVKERREEEGFAALTQNKYKYKWILGSTETAQCWFIFTYSRKNRKQNKGKWNNKSSFSNNPNKQTTNNKVAEKKKSESVQKGDKIREGEESARILEQCHTWN